MPYGYPVSPQAIGQALVQYQPPQVPAPRVVQPQPSTANPMAQAANTALGGLADAANQRTAQNRLAAALPLSQAQQDATARSLGFADQNAMMQDWYNKADDYMARQKAGLV